jgi:hypothetical protein
MMRDSDETIQRVLVGLRDAEAPDGMERRIVDALENRASGHAAWYARGWKQFWKPVPERLNATQTWARRIALASTVAVCFVIAVINRERVPTQPKLRDHVAVSAPEVVAVGAAQIAHAPSTYPSARIRTRTPAPKRSLSNVHDSAALAEIHAASHPAPIAPLTQEEKLLRQIALRGDPQALAMLNPQIQARREAESEEEFLKFIEEPAKGDSE